MKTRQNRSSACSRDAAAIDHHGIHSFMASDRAERRRRLFRLYSANLAIHIPADEGFCACPICLDGYNDAGVEPQTLALDIAHVYPESCGGGPETLTCKRCNSRMRSMYESHVAKDYQIVDALGGSAASAQRCGRRAITSTSTRWRSRRTPPSGTGSLRA